LGKSNPSRGGLPALSEGDEVTAATGVDEDEGSEETGELSVVSELTGE